MVKFLLLCDQAHEFEGWFQNNESFDGQQAAMQIICPHCASAVVRKALMTPNLSSSKTRARILAPSESELETSPPESTSESVSAEASPVPTGASESAPVPNAKPDSDTKSVVQATDAPAANVPAAGPPKMAQMMQMLRHMHKMVAENCTDVGSGFADEARKMHNGEADAKPIYGTSTADEREELAEDGIPFAQLPTLPKDH